MIFKKIIFKIIWIYKNDVIIPGKLDIFAGTSTQIIRIGQRNNCANFNAFSTIFMIQCIFYTIRLRKTSCNMQVHHCINIPLISYLDLLFFKDSHIIFNSFLHTIILQEKKAKTMIIWNVYLRSHRPAGLSQTFSQTLPPSSFPGHTLTSYISIFSLQFSYSRVSLSCLAGFFVYLRRASISICVHIERIRRQNCTCSVT